MICKIMNENDFNIQDWKGFEYTGELMYIQYPGGGDEIQRVIKGKFTPHGAVRDCGDHYIKANYSSYTRIDKGTMKLTHDVEDC